MAFLRDLPFLLHLTIDPAQNEWNNSLIRDFLIEIEKQWKSKSLFNNIQINEIQENIDEI